ncbi:MAG: hypothetical protein AAF755_07770 [Pseudomonadota bacterium]
MIKQSVCPLLAALLLSACQPGIPDSGFRSGLTPAERSEQTARDAALAGSPIDAPAEVTALPLGPAGSAAPSTVQQDSSSAATAAETTRILAATRSGTGIAATDALGNETVTDPSEGSQLANATTPLVNSAGISSENNFDAVSSSRSIDDDAALRAANRAQYQVIPPEALPERVPSGPNIVSYALSTTHAPGTKLYNRITLNREARFRRACAAYPSADQAQIDFLARGGPERDRRGVDPDGDGFACNWDPRPFRLAADQG